MKCKACEGIGFIEVNEKETSYKNVCYLCDGIGDIVVCNPCNGKGEIISNYRFTPCMMCRGNGFSPKVIYDCKLCDGEKIMESISPNGFEDFVVIRNTQCKEEL